MAILILRRNPSIKFSRAIVLLISFSALRSWSSRVFSSPSSRVVSFSSHCSARSIASARTEPGVMSCSLGVMLPKYRFSRVSHMCAASFSTTQHTTENRKSQGYDTLLSDCYHFRQFGSPPFSLFYVPQFLKGPREKFFFVYAYHFLKRPVKDSPQHLGFPECWGEGVQFIFCPSS